MSLFNQRSAGDQTSGGEMGQRIRRKLSWKICDERVQRTVRWRMFHSRGWGARAQSPRVIAARQKYRVDFQVTTLFLGDRFKIHK